MFCTNSDKDMVEDVIEETAEDVIEETAEDVIGRHTNSANTKCFYNK